MLTVIKLAMNRPDPSDPRIDPSRYRATVASIRAMTAADITRVVNFSAPVSPGEGAVRDRLEWFVMDALRRKGLFVASEPYTERKVARVLDEVRENWVTEVYNAGIARYFVLRFINYAMNGTRDEV